MVTVKELARMCGVSTSTISNVLNGKANVGPEVRKTVMEAIESTGYKPNYFARNMRKPKEKTIGIIAEDLCQFSTPYIVETILDHLENSGYSSVLMNLRMYSKWRFSFIEDEEMLHRYLDPVIEQMRSMKVDGIVYVAAHCRRLHAVSSDFEIPIVYAYAVEDMKGAHSVILDDEGGAYEVVSHLIAKGHRNIGVIAGRGDNFHTKERMKGLSRALSENGIELDRNNVRYGSWDKRSGYETAGELIDRGVTAIWCMNDRMAAGVYQAANERNLTVGKDISVAGFDNQDVSWGMTPELTTVELPLFAIGNCAARLLLEKIEGVSELESGAALKKLGCRFIERSSVANVTGL